MSTASSTARRATVATTLAAVLGACATTPRPPPLAEPGAGQAGGPQAVAAAPASTVSVAPAATTARGAFAEGVRLEGAGDLQGAAAAFERAAALEPSLAWASFDAGLLHERLGQEPLAVAAYQRAIDAQPGFAQAGQNLARIWIRQGKLEEAEKTLRQRLAQADGVAQRVALAEVLLAAGRLDEAEAECRSALKADERNVPAMVVLATTYGGKKRHELAKMVLENAQQVDPGDPAVLNRLGFVELALGNRPQAIEQFKAAAALRPDYPEAHANYGAMLADADDFAGAAAELELAVKYAPRAAGAWLDLGNAYRGLQQFERSEQAYQKALELEPGLSDAHFDLALLFLDVEKPGLPTLQRLEQGLAHFDAFEKAGGREPRVAAYRKDAARELDREKKRLAREEKDRARQEAEARRKADEEARLQAEAEAAAKARADAAAEAEAAAARAQAEVGAQAEVAAPAAAGAAPQVPPTVSDSPPAPAPSSPSGAAEPGSGK